MSDIIANILAGGAGLCALAGVIISTTGDNTFNMWAMNSLIWTILYITKR